ncbi:Uncharacterized protein APZ42_010963 [Daphnia magna]|uniref:DDE-1 domain-containing protein n=1 Tax=Daphnia magna TaxID=35525 RepID=A0A162TBW2_9CRUS|nr:Uncharacterized protein APZ42_010963 [Daphnia magna]
MRVVRQRLSTCARDEQIGLKKKKRLKIGFHIFFKRNPSLSIRAPEATIVTKHNIRSGRVWNTDETGVPAVMPAPNVIATKGLKQVQQTVSNERGVNTTMVAFISDDGTHIPLVYIFPRKNFLSSMSCHRPPGCLALAHPSGWINGDTFLTSLQYFKKFADCSVSNPVLFFLDNHSSHLDYKVICFAKENGIHMPTFPPHCFHRLQPLYITVFGPSKSALRNSFQDWLNVNPGKRISIHEVAELTRNPYLLSFTPENIISGFKNSGISLLIETFFLHRSICRHLSLIARLAADDRSKSAVSGSASYDRCIGCTVSRSTVSDLSIGSVVFGCDQSTNFRSSINPRSEQIQRDL